jgi:anthranilate synthase component 1
MLLETFPSREEFRSLLDTSSVVPVGARILADTETPVSVLARFAPHHPHLFLLESAEGGERWGRYSFMGVTARATVTVYRNDVVVRQDIQEKRIPHQGDPLAVLRGIMKPYSLAHLPGLPRFCGGLVGYFSYEMIHFFEPRVPNKLPPERPMAEFVIPDTLLIFDNVTHTLTALALAFQEDGEAEALFDAATARVQDLLATLAKPLPVGSVTGKTPIRKPQPVHPPEYFKGMVGKVKDHIYEGDVIQCVVSQSFVGPAPDDLVSLYRAQRHVNPSPHRRHPPARRHRAGGPQERRQPPAGRKGACRTSDAGRPRPQRAGTRRHPRHRPGHGPDDRRTLFARHAPGLQHHRRHRTGP